MKSRLVLLCLALIVLSGCSYALKIAVAWLPDGRPFFTISRALILANDLGSQGADLNSFDVIQKVKDGWDYKHPVWSFQLPPGSSKPIENVLYGEVPVGFEESSPPLPLMPGVRYQAVALGPGCGGSVEFSIQR